MSGVSVVNMSGQKIMNEAHQQAKDQKQATEQQVVRASFCRCDQNLEFIEHFYQRFLESSPRVAQFFVGVDMDHQAVMMRASLEVMLQGVNETTRPQLEQLRQVHEKVQGGVPHELYECWLESLIEAVEALDPRCDEALKAAWRRVLEPGVRFMQGVSEKT